MFLARLFGFLVVLVFIVAIGLSLVAGVSFPDLMQDETLSGKKESQAVQEFIDSSVILSDKVPAEFRVESAKSSPLRVVETKSIAELQELIFENGSVLVVLDNARLKNPFIVGSKKFAVVLTGFNKTHFFSTGEEMRKNGFVYGMSDIAKSVEWDLIYVIR